MSSVTARVFRGCRALLAPATAAKSSAKTAAKTSAKDPSKLPEKPRKTTPKAASPRPTRKPRTTTAPTGFSKVIRVSPTLGQLLGAQEASRVDAIKQLWSYIKTNNLQNPANKKEIICDEKLKAIFDGKEKVHMLEVGKLLSPHFVKDG